MPWPFANENGHESQSGLHGGARTSQPGNSGEGGFGSPGALAVQPDPSSRSPEISPNVRRLRRSGPPKRGDACRVCPAHPADRLVAVRVTVELCDEDAAVPVAQPLRDDPRLEAEGVEHVAAPKCRSSWKSMRSSGSSARRWCRWW